MVLCSSSVSLTNGSIYKETKVWICCLLIIYNLNITWFYTPVAGNGAKTYRNYKNSHWIELKFNFSVLLNVKETHKSLSKKDIMSRYYIKWVQMFHTGKKCLDQKFANNFFPYDKGIVKSEPNWSQLFDESREKPEVSQVFSGSLSLGHICQPTKRKQTKNLLLLKTNEIWVLVPILFYVITGELGWSGGKDLVSFLV